MTMRRVQIASKGGADRASKFIRPTKLRRVKFRRFKVEFKRRFRRFSDKFAFSRMPRVVGYLRAGPSVSLNLHVTIDAAPR